MGFLADLLRSAETGDIGAGTARAYDPALEEAYKTQFEGLQIGADQAASQAAEIDAVKNPLHGSGLPYAQSQMVGSVYRDPAELGATRTDDGKIVMAMPDGRLKKVPVEKVKQARAAGLDYAPKPVIREVEDKRKFGDAGHGVRDFLSQAAKPVTLGISDLAERVAGGGLRSEAPQYWQLNQMIDAGMSPQQMLEIRDPLTGNQVVTPELLDQWRKDNAGYLGYEESRGKSQELHTGANIAGTLTGAALSASRLHPVGAIGEAAGAKAAAGVAERLGPSFGVASPAGSAARGALMGASKGAVEGLVQTMAVAAESKISNQPLGWESVAAGVGFGGLIGSLPGAAKGFIEGTASKRRIDSVLRAIEKNSAKIDSVPEIQAAKKELATAEAMTRRMSEEDIAAKTALDEQLDTVADRLLPSGLKRKKTVEYTDGTQGFEEVPIGARQLFAENAAGKVETPVAEKAAAKIGRQEGESAMDFAMRQAREFEERRAADLSLNEPKASPDEKSTAELAMPAGQRQAQQQLRSQLSKQKVRDQALLEAGADKAKTFDELAVAAEKAADKVDDRELSLSLRADAQELRSTLERTQGFTGSVPQEGFKPGVQLAKWELAGREVTEGKRILDTDALTAPAQSQPKLPADPEAHGWIDDLMGGGKSQSLGHLVARSAGYGAGHAAGVGLASMFGADPTNPLAHVVGFAFGRKGAYLAGKYLTGMPQRLWEGIKGGASRIGDTAASRATQRVALATAVKSYLPEGVKPGSLGESVGAAVEHLREMNANPEATQRRIYNSLGEVRMSDPELAQQLEDHFLARIKFLEEKAPKVSFSLSPFMKQKEVPNDADASSFARYAIAADDPMKLMDEMAEGQVNEETVEAVKVLYPRMFQEMQKVATERLMELESLDYAQRAAISQVFGIELEPTLNPTFAAAMNTFFTQQQPQDKGPGKLGGETVPNSPRNRKVSPKAAGQSTQSQRFGG